MTDAGENRADQQAMFDSFKMKVDLRLTARDYMGMFWMFGFPLMGLRIP
jgi:hypothetical protein